MVLAAHPFQRHSRHPEVFVYRFVSSHSWQNVTRAGTSFESPGFFAVLDPGASAPSALNHAHARVCLFKCSRFGAGLASCRPQQVWKPRPPRELPRVQEWVDVSIHNRLVTLDVCQPRHALRAICVSRSASAMSWASKSVVLGPTSVVLLLCELAGWRPRQVVNERMSYLHF